MHVGTEPARLGVDRQSAGRVVAQLAPTLRRGQQLERLLDGELIGRQRSGNAGGVVAPDQVGAVVAPRLGHDEHPVGIEPDRDGVHQRGVDVVESGRHLLLEPTRPLPVDVGRTEVEVRQPRHQLLGPAGDLIEIVFHPRREGVVDEVREMLLEQVDHRERLERRHESGALLPDVLTILDHLDRRGIGRGSANTEFLKPLDQRCLGEAGRWLGLVAMALDVAGRQRIALGQRRQLPFLLLGLVTLVTVDDVGEPKSLVRDDRAAGGELGIAPAERFGAGCGRTDERQRRARRGIRRAEPNGDGLAGGVVHLRGDGALPDELVDLGVVGVDLAGDVLGGAEAIAGRPNGLVGLLRVLHLVGIGPRGVGHELRPVALGDLAAGGGQRGTGQRGRVGTHVGDEAGLVEALGRPHGHRRRQPQLAARLLLEGRGDERRRRAPSVGLALDPSYLERRLVCAQGSGESRGPRLIEHNRLTVQHAVLAEVLAGGQLATVERHHGGGEGAALVTGGRPGRGKPTVEIPVAGRDEGHPLTLALDDQPGGDALDPAHRGALPDLLAGGTGQRAVTIDAVEQTASLLRVDQPTIDVARVGHGLGDRLRGDLVEDHALDRHRVGRVEHLEQVPRDGLAFAILIRCEIELRGALHQLLQVADAIALVGADDVERLEVVVDLDAEDLPGLLVGLGHVGRSRRKVTNVAHRCLDHDIANDGARRVQELLDGLRLGG